jgi:DNA-binding NarL/FixJ family response regulator
MNILIVDDHKILAEGLAELIKKDKSFKIEGIITNGLDVIPFLEKHQPDLIILDLEMPDINGAALAKEILAVYKDMKIMILTMHTEPVYFDQLFNIGIAGYLNKNADKAEILEALDCISKGKTYFNRDIVTEYINFQKTPQSKKPEELRITQREKEVLQLIMEGLTTAQISEKLFVSQNTIDSHRKNLLSKLGVKNTAELVKLAIEKQLI